MSFWWVNHKQTFRHEFHGGYLWSPKRKKDGSRNIFYDFMQMVRPGDFVVSYADGHVRGIGKAITHCYTSPRPDEFGHIGMVWDNVGWRVDVTFTPARPPVRPRDLLNEIGHLIGQKYSPLSVDGAGRQIAYLAAISDQLGRIIADRISVPLDGLRAAEGSLENEVEIALPGIDEWERIERAKIEAAEIPETERVALIKARVGQGRFKQNVSRYEFHCRITRVDNPVHLVASHLKPWRESNNDERLAAGNGLLLTPTIDHLLDRGFISFDDSGDTLISPVAEPVSLKRMGIDPDRPPNVGKFNSDQKFFLNYHRSSVFLAGVKPS